MTEASSDVIFNIVLIGNSFWHLRYFVCSLLDQCDAQFRLVANGCAPESLAEIADFARRHDDRVVEVLDVSPDVMVAHGVAVDSVRAVRDDGELICFVDPDIEATGPFLERFLAVLTKYDAVTSGKELWTEENVLPPDQIGVGGRHFFDSNGFTFGSPHFAMYNRAAIDDTFSRWGVGFGSAGPDLSDAARARMADAGHPYRIYDTGKIANILFQLDGHSLTHVEHDEFLHIGGLSHFISPSTGAKSGEVEKPAWARYGGVEARFELAKFAAAVLRALIEQQPVPPVPADADPAHVARLELLRHEMTDLVTRYRDY